MPGIPFYSTNLTVRATAKIAGLVFYTSGIESYKAYLNGTDIVASNLALAIAGTPARSKSAYLDA